MFYRNCWLIIVWIVVLTFQMEVIAEEDRKLTVKASESKKNLQLVGIDTETLSEIVKNSRPSKPSHQEEKERGKENASSSQTVATSSR